MLTEEQSRLPLYLRSRQTEPLEHKGYASQRGMWLLGLHRPRGCARKSDWHTQAEEILNKKSGWKAMTGTTDFSQIATQNPPTDKHRLAFDIFVDRIAGLIGNYFVKLDGKVDALVFAGGIGEKSALLRKAVVEKCHCLGFAINQGENSKGPEESATITDISQDPGRIAAVLVCQTNEEVRHH